MKLLRKLFYSLLLVGVGVSLGLVIGEVSPIPSLLRDVFLEPIQTVVVSPSNEEPSPAAPLQAFRQLQEGTAPQSEPVRSEPVRSERAQPEPAPAPVVDVAAGGPEVPKGPAERALARITDSLTLDPGDYTGEVVQVASYRDPRSAEALARRLLRAGFHAYVSRSHPSGDIRHRVRVRPASGQEVAELSAALQERGLSVWVTNE
jgi:cell division protein FtsN